MKNTYKSILAGTAVSVLALSTASLAFAQDSLQDEVIVTGIKSSLKQSLDVKRNAESIVDAISAEDVGKFPDSNIADSLQRITGVSIDRSGGEGQFITVRGLGPEFNTVLVNGRTMATDNPGREFSFDVLSSDIISRAEVFKSPTPDLQEGGIGATVNIVTARPLDLSGTNITGSIAGIYDTLDETVSPEASLTISHTDETGNWGIVGSIAYSDRSTQIDQALIEGFRDVNILSVNGDANSTGLQQTDLESVSGLQVPRNVVFIRDEADRERIVGNVTLQGRLSDNVEVTLDGLFSDFSVNSVTNRFTPFFVDPFIGVEVDGNNTITGFNRPGQTFLDANPDLTIGISQNDNVAGSNDRQAQSYLVGGNVKWDVSEELKLTADVSVSGAERDSLTPFVVVGTLATTSPRFDLNPQNDIPSVTNLGIIDDATQLRNHFSRVQNRTVDDDIVELKLQGDWDANKGVLETISVGGFYSDRQKVTTFADTAASSRCLYCGYNFSIDTALVSPFSFGSGFLSAASGSEDVPQSFFSYDPFEVLNFLSQESNLRNNQRQPGQTQAQIDAAADAALALPGGPFAPQIQLGSGSDVTEEVASFFINTKWGGDFGGELPWSANVGFRLSQTDTTSVGFGVELVDLTRPPGDDRIDPTFTTPQPLTAENDYINFLPSANLKLDIAEDQVLRFSVSETVTRPTLTDLGTNTTFGTFRTSGGVSSGGNPELEPFESTNYDVSYEWYYGDSSFFGVSGFHKEFSNFLESQTLINQFEFFDQVFDETLTVDVEDTRVRNGEEGSITGIETAIQHGFDNGLGFIANYTYVTSDVERAPGSAAADCNYNGLSPHSFNVSGYYEKDRIQARLSYNWRDAFLRRCFGQQGRPENVESFGQLDFSAAYDLTDNFQVFAQGVNILDADNRAFSVFEDRFTEYTDTGSRFKLGVRGKF